MSELQGLSENEKKKTMQIEKSQQLTVATAYDKRRKRCSWDAA